MQTEELRRWRRQGGEAEGDKAALFCCGDPGVGGALIRQQGLFFRRGRKRAHAGQPR